MSFDWQYFILKIFKIEHIQTVEIMGGGEGIFSQIIFFHKIIHIFLNLTS